MVFDKWFKKDLGIIWKSEPQSSSPRPLAKSAGPIKTTFQLGSPPPSHRRKHSSPDNELSNRSNQSSRRNVQSQGATRPTLKYSASENQGLVYQRENLSPLKYTRLSQVVPKPPAFGLPLTPSKTMLSEKSTKSVDATHKDAGIKTVEYPLEKKMRPLVVETNDDPPPSDKENAKFQDLRQRLLHFLSIAKQCWALYSSDPQDEELDKLAETICNESSLMDSIKFVSEPSKSHGNVVEWCGKMEAIASLEDFVTLEKIFESALLAVKTKTAIPTNVGTQKITSPSSVTPVPPIASSNLNSTASLNQPYVGDLVELSNSSTSVDSMSTKQKTDPKQEIRQERSKLQALHTLYLNLEDNHARMRAVARSTTNQDLRDKINVLSQKADYRDAIMCAGRALKQIQTTGTRLPLKNDMVELKNTFLKWDERHGDALREFAKIVEEHNAESQRDDSNIPVEASTSKLSAQEPRRPSSSSSSSSSSSKSKSKSQTAPLAEKIKRPSLQTAIKSTSAQKTDLEELAEMELVDRPGVQLQSVVKRDLRPNAVGLVDEFMLLLVMPCVLLMMIVLIGWMEKGEENEDAQMRKNACRWYSRLYKSLRKAVSARMEDAVVMADEKRSAKLVDVKLRLKRRIDEIAHCKDTATGTALLVKFRATPLTQTVLDLLWRPHRDALLDGCVVQNHLRRASYLDALEIPVEEIRSVFGSPIAESKTVGLPRPRNPCRVKERVDLPALPPDYGQPACDEDEFDISMYFE